MRHLVVAATLLLVSPAAFAEKSIPSLTVKDGSTLRELEIVGLGIRVDIRGMLAETTYELTYKNSSENRLEGEFSLELPTDATVSTFALEVNGGMRPAVSVGKDKARNAYETIKRRGIDPGIVERINDNTYRTRIFPILPRSTKRVRIGYITRIEKGRYQLPIHHGREIERFELRVVGINGLPEFDCLGVPNPEFVGTREVIWSGKRFRPNATLSVGNLWTGERGGPRIDLARTRDGTQYFAIQAPLPPPSTPPFPKSWDHIHVIWDASRSGAWRDVKADITALQQLWEKIPSGSISLQLLRTDLTNPETFPIIEGVASEFEKRIGEIRYDGAADFTLIRPGQIPTILVTDGRASTPTWIPKFQKPIALLALLCPPSSTVDPAFYEAAIPILRRDSKNWVDDWVRDHRGQAVSIDGLHPENWEVSDHGSWFLATGVIPPGNGVMTLRTSDGRSITLPPDPEEKTEWSFARRVRGQQRLAELEQRGSPEPITEFAKQERLASDHTSLIVLEFLRDHVRFRIPPPEDTEKAKYLSAIQSEHNRVQSYRKQAWIDKLKRYQTEFRWFDSNLESEVATIAIWLDSARIAFPEEVLPEVELAPYERWLDKANRVIDRESDVETREELGKWTADIDNTLANLAKIRAFPPIPPDDAQQIHVSVRGFVKQRGVQSGSKALTLREAISKAGGPNRFGEWSRIFLYRDAARTGYNLASDRSIPVPLQWGDMIVVEEEPSSYWRHSSDPFADPFMSTPRTTPTESAPIFEPTGSSKASPSLAHGGDVLGGTKGEREASAMNSTITLALPEMPGNVDPDVIEDLTSSESPEDGYRAIMDGIYGREIVSPATVIEVSRYLAANGEPVLARQSLSNLLEIQANRIEAARSYAYWLAELGQAKEAIAFLEALKTHVADESTRVLILYDIAQLTGEARHFHRASEAAWRNPEYSRSFPILMTDRFRGSYGSGPDALTKDAMPSDIRVVVTTIGDTIGLDVTTPTVADEFTDTGAIRNRGDRVTEWQIRRAWPGTYRFQGIRWDGEEPVTAHLRIYTNWGRPEEKVITKTFLINSKTTDLGSIDFGFGE